MAFVLLLQAGLDVLADVQMFIVIEVHAPGAPFEGLMSCCAAGRHRPLILENRPRGVPRPICLETSGAACFLGKLFTAKDAKDAKERLAPLTRRGTSLFVLPGPGAHESPNLALF